MSSKLLMVFIKVGLFSFGGFGGIPLIQQEVINHYQWLNIDDFINMITISQLTPGPIGINIATFTGYTLDGLSGALIATMGYVLPSLIIITIIGHLYFKYRDIKVLDNILKGIRPAIIAIIIGTAFIFMINAFQLPNNFNINGLNYYQIILFIISLYLLLKHQMSPIKLIIFMIMVNLVVFMIV
ncbi:MAG: chromate transporter [Bacilli bacterium]|jgi:chromate transporter|nr:chromate transporter [Bacilli bacterium]